jgi:glutaredoxin
MRKTIEVYVMNKEIITSKSLEGRPVQGHYCTVKEISKTEKIISEEDEAALKLVEELAVEKNLRFRVIDVASLRGKLSARLKGVKATPTIIVGGRQIVGVPKKEEFEALLEQ